MTKYVLTGATGSIGTALINEILAEGGSVLVIVRPEGKLHRIPQHENVRVLQYGLSELDKIRPEGEYDAFFHLGWQSAGTSEYARDDVFAQEANVRYTLDAAALAHRLKCKVFVGAGSQAEYGRVEGKMTPSTPANPENAYGIAKYAAGKLSRVACAQQGIRHNWARILSVYGPGDNDYTMVMHCVFSLLAGKPPALTKCGHLWDYCYSEDVARALLAIAKNGKEGAVYCVGSGEERPMKEYVEAIRTNIKDAPAANYGGRDYNKNQVMRLCADISSLCADTGWAPRIGFEEGIKKTIDWVRNEQQS